MISLLELVPYKSLMLLLLYTVKEDLLAIIIILRLICSSNSEVVINHLQLAMTMRESSEVVRILAK